MKYNTKEWSTFYEFKIELANKYGENFKNPELSESEFDKLYALKQAANNSTSINNFLKKVV